MRRLLCEDIANAAGHSIVKPDFFQVFKRQPFGDAQVSKILSTSIPPSFFISFAFSSFQHFAILAGPLSKDHCASVTDSSPLGGLFGIFKMLFFISFYIYETFFF